MKFLQNSYLFTFNGKQYSNDQWRICFVWREGHAYEVEIVDYH
jgi:proteic killer suppression protein